MNAAVAAWLVSMPLALAQGDENFPQNTTAWAASRVRSAEQAFGFSPRMPSPTTWAGEVVYGIMVDRFNDGDPGNNPPAAGGVAVARHGGDLRGIVQRLDYLVDLGVTTLWLTPVFAHDGNYHGYCATDPTRVDPGFGSLEDLRTLVSEAHQRGLRVWLDVVVNHLCDPQTKYSRAPERQRCGDDLMAAHWLDQAPQSSAQGTLDLGPNFFAPFRQPAFFNRCGANSTADTGGRGSLAVFGDFVGTMFDYNTRDADFVQLFVDLHKYWIAAADIDGFRLDAAKHVTEDFLATLSTELRAYALSLGKDNFYLVAEVYGDAEPTARRFGTMFSNPRNPADNGGVPASLTHTLQRLQSTYLAHPKAPYPGPNGVFHFEAAYAGRDYLQNRAGAAAVRDYYASEAFRTVAAQGDTNLLLNFLDSHDWPRFAHPVAEDPWKSKLAVGYLNTTPGIPVYYYGVEQGFNGVCRSNCEGPEDAQYRQDMFMGPWRLGSTVPQIDALAAVGQPRRAAPDDWTQDPMLARDHEVYRAARRFARLRRSCPALQRGSMQVHHASDALLVFTRRLGGTEMLVAINNASSGRRLPAMPVQAADGTLFRNAVSAAAPDGSAFTAQGGLLAGGVEMPGNSVWVWAPADALQAWDAGDAVALCNPLP